MWKTSTTRDGDITEGGAPSTHGIAKNQPAASPRTTTTMGDGRIATPAFEYASRKNAFIATNGSVVLPVMGSAGAHVGYGDGAAFTSARSVSAARRPSAAAPCGDNPLILLMEAIGQPQWPPASSEATATVKRSDGAGVMETTVTVCGFVCFPMAAALALLLALLVARGCVAASPTAVIAVCNGGYKGACGGDATPR
jgi:hypothetical protein